jgi:hypothetical protein
MRKFIRPAATALSIACLAASIAAVSTDSALAQANQQMAPAPAGQPQALKQIALTDKQIEGVLAAQKDMNAITDKLPENSKPDPKVIAQLEAIAKKDGFASYEAVIKSQIVQVQADKKMSAKDKKQALDDLNAALKAPEPPLENKGNIDLVTKYYDKLAELFGDDQN